MSKTELYLSKIVKYGLYAVLLTPLAFWPKALFPFSTPKFILFQVLVEIVFAAWLILKFLKPNFRNWLVVALVLFTAISFISALLGIDFSRSFWGIGPRMTGLFAELHFFAWFLVLASSLNYANRDKQLRMMQITNKSKGLAMSDIGNKLLNWHNYLNFSFFVALVVAATAFYQNSAWGLSFGSTIFNNPTFVAPYLIFHFFWGLYQFILPKSDFSRSPTSRSPEVGLQMPNSDFRRWFFGASSIFILFVILLGQVRGAILGFFIGILFLLLVLILTNIFTKRTRIILSACFLAILIAAAGFWQFRSADFLRNGVLRKFTEISFSNYTVKTRLLAWQISLKGFQSAGWWTVLGVGPENFNYIFNKYYDPRFLKFGGGGFGETWFDKPHNAFLEILTETGIVGSLAYILIWLSVAFYLFKLFKNIKTNTSIIPIMEAKVLSLVLTGAFVAYFGAVFFSFDSFGSLFGLFLFLAFIASHNIEVRLRGFLKSDFNIGNMRIPRIANTVYSQLASLAIVLITFVLLYVNYSIWRANLADADALRTFPKDTVQGVTLFKKSLNHFTPYKAEYQFDLIASVAGALQKNVQLPNPEEIINFALEAADKALTAHPKNAASYTDMARIYMILGERGRDQAILAQAEAYGKKSLELSPNRQETLFYLTKNSLLLSDTKSAVSYMTQAVNAEPSIGLSHWYLGLAYIADNQKNKGASEIKKALELDYNPQSKAEENFIKNLGL